MSCLAPPAIPTVVNVQKGTEKEGASAWRPTDVVSQSDVGGSKGGRGGDGRELVLSMWTASAVLAPLSWGEAAHSQVPC